MTSRILTPTTGFTEFDLYRRSYEDEVTIAIGDSTYVVEQGELTLWLRNIGWKNVSRLVDMVWNFRAIHCNRATSTFTMPKKQQHPEDVEDETVYAVSAR